MAENVTYLNGVDTVLSQSSFATKKLKLSGTFIINTPISLVDIDVVGVGTTTITLTNQITIDSNVNIDGIVFDFINAFGDPFMITGKNSSLKKNTFKNAYALTNVHVVTILQACENVTLEKNTFTNLSVFEDGIINNGQGILRAIQCQNGKNIIIEDNTFEGIQGYEDSDYIHIQSSSQKTVNGKTYFEHGSIKIRRNKFINPKKSVVKIQCSGVEVTDNFIESDGLSEITVLFRAYNSMDINISRNKTNDKLLATNGFQIDTVLNGTFENNKVYLKRPVGFSGSLFFIMDTNSEDVNFKNNDVVCSGSNLIKLSGTTKSTFTENVMDYTTFELSNVSDVKILSNTVNKIVYAFLEFLVATINSNIKIQNNSVEEATRLTNVRNDQNTNIYYSNNTVLKYGSNFSAIAFYLETQDKQQFVVIDKGMLTLSYGTTGSRPSFKRYVGYPYYDTDKKKQLVWDGVNWVDYAGVTVI